MLDTARRTAFSADHYAFRDQVRRFLARELLPHMDRESRCFAFASASPSSAPARKPRQA